MLPSISKSDVLLGLLPGCVSSVASNEHVKHTWAYLLPMCVLSFGLLVTFNVRQSIQKQYETLEAVTFKHAVADLTTFYTNVLRQHESLLKSVRGLYSASDSVTRVAFDDFMSSINLLHSFPATKGVAWHPKVREDEVPLFEASIAADRSLNGEGYPGFHIKPASQNFEHFPVIYAAPKENLDILLGYDLAPSETRYMAVLKTRDTGELHGTAPIELMDLKGQTNSTGFVLALAVYGQSIPSTILDRRAQFKGVLTATFQTTVLLGNKLVENFSAVQVYDVTDAERNLLYSTGQAMPEDQSVTTRFEIAGRTWEFNYRKGMAHRPVWFGLSAYTMAAFLGIVISLLLALLTYVLITSRNSALIRAASLTQDLQRVNNDLTRSNHDLGQFAFVASHDLQTPIRNVQSTIVLLEDTLAGLDNPSATRYLGHLQKSASHMQNFIGDLLIYAQVERPQHILEPVDLNVIFSDVLERLKFMTDETDTVIAVEHLPQILGDADQLSRLFTNLLTNSIKYCEPSRSPVISVYAKRVDKQWVVRVKDNGIGIEPKHQARVLEPFQRLHRHDEIAGSGLGLNICQEIMIKHEGQLQIESEFGKGTVCILLFPRMKAWKRAA